MKINNDNWNAEDYATHASFVSALSQEVMKDLSPRQGEHILDLGCGDGELAALMQNQHGVTVLGIDSSESFVETAQKRGVNARVGDAQDMQFDCEFDAVFSNAALHWMPQQQELIKRVFKALKPGGRFVAEMGGAGNIRLIRQAMTEILAERGVDFASRDPWTFPTPDEHRERLLQAGFNVIKCNLRKRPTPLPTDVGGWFETFCNEILSDFSMSDRRQSIDAMAEQLRPKICDADGTWTADYVRLNFIALKP
jgi:ubiquinone/menaquinone biosynthesis C-methylase UbiE